jgi:GntR family transcriptional regulator
MTEQWNDNSPIYRQIRDRVARLIMDGSFPEEDAIPSVRAVAAESRVNHLTVGKAYQELVDQGVLEVRRGLGMFVKVGARETLLKQERKTFISEELPATLERIKGLGISIDDFISLLKDSNSQDGETQ